MKIKNLFILVLVICLTLTGTIFATDKLEFLKNEYSDIKTEEEIMKKLDSKSFDELLSEINILGDITGEGFIYHANALTEKSINVSDERIQAEILNENNSLATRVTLIQISSLIGSNLDVNVMQDVLFDNNADFEIKRNSLIYLYQSNNLNTEIVEKLSLGNDEELAFQAIKILDKINPVKSIKIADDILNKYTGDVDEKVRAAIKVKAKHLADNSTIEERIEFINFCDSILTSINNSKAKENGTIISDTVIFALSNVKSEETISYIISNNMIDTIAKIFCVDQNYFVLKSMITDKNISDENLSIVIEAMYICPIKDMEESLLNALSEKSQQHFGNSEKNVEKLQDILKLIDKEGVKATQKFN